MCRHSFILVTAVMFSAIGSSVAIDERAPHITTIYRGSQIPYKAGEDITLPCQADGSPVPEYSWKKNGVTLTVSLPDYTWVPGSGNLVIKSPTPDVDGEYNCLASNRFGTSVGMKIKVQMAVLEPFPTVANPTLLTPVIGESLKIACTPPQSYPNPQGSTYFSYNIYGNKLKDIVYDNRVMLDYKGNIYFANVIANDSLLHEGEGSNYLCVVNNQLLGAYSQGNDHRLRPRTFQGRPEYRPVHLMWPFTRTTVAIKGWTKTLKCIYGGLPTPAVTWHSDKESPRFVVTSYGHGTEIGFDNVDFQDEGFYTCSASNSPSGQSVSHRIRMIVQSPPFWNNKPADRYVNEDSDIEVDCSVSGTPKPTVEWSINGVPVNETHFSGRKSLIGYKLRYRKVTVNDSQVIQCTATNEHGSILTNVILKVYGNIPFWNNKPADRYVNEDSDIEVDCSVSGKPKPTVEWSINGVPVNETHFSGRKSLIGYKLRYRKVTVNDSQVIQCTATNDYGSILTNVILKVYVRTEVTITGSKEVSVDFQEQKHFIFQCEATSDPDTPATVRWHKTEPFGDLVRNEPPYILVEKEFLIIMVYPNCSSQCSKYLGEYMCTGASEFSEDNQTITLSYQNRPSPDKSIQKEEAWPVWKIIVVAGVLGFSLFLVGMFLGFRSRRYLAVNRRTKDRNPSNSYSTYNRIIYDSVGINPQALGNAGELMRRAVSVYDHPGYDSIDQVLEDMTRREQHVWSSDANAYNGYESIDEPHREAINRPTPDGDAMYDEMGYSISQEEIENRVETNQDRVYSSRFALHQSQNCSISNVQLESINAYSDQSRKDFSLGLNLGLSAESLRKMNREFELTPMEVNPYLDLSSKDDANLYLGLVSKEVSPYLNMSSKDPNPYSDLIPKEENAYLDLSEDANPPLDLESKDVNPYLELLEEVNHPLSLTPKKVNPHLDSGVG